ncbi:hypothetical protein AVME950_20705 [Acidovorax sp. SUPP950]|uniref:hypothetical protein n=1 Tax=Acidovorax sp. SUPP950 TaxID=511901 RepID=UPI0023BF4F15|nr:hypothetical protein [Acidovorax sp. SUPP950]GKS77359.1 hypothetical protein AVME950_20705 [Acidovorax sp. SUPP950]
MSKAKTLEAVQVFAPGEMPRLAKLKKAQIASEAGRLAAGSGWLPVMFGEPVAVIADEHPVVAIEVEAGGVEVEDSSETHAAA